MQVFKLAACLLDHLGQFLNPLDEIVRMNRASNYHQTGQEGEGPGGIILGEHFSEAVENKPTATADYIVSFLANPAFRNSISSPNRCDKKDFGR